MHDIDKASEFFNALTRKHGDAPQSLDWGGERTQRMRFGVLAEVGELEGRSVLDVGCGFADFAAYLEAQGVNARYVGVDVASEVVAMARAKRPHLDIRLGRVEDVEETFDYVVASGIFNLKVEDNYGLTEAILRAMAARSRRAVAANFISGWHGLDSLAEHIFAHDPDRMLRTALGLAPFATLRHDYLPHDFTLYLHMLEHRDRA